MSKLSSILRIVGLVLLVGGAAAARSPGWSSAYQPAAYGTARTSTQRTGTQRTSTQRTSTQQTSASQPTDGVTWTTQRFGDRSYWYASDGTTCVCQKQGQKLVIHCY